MANDFWLDSYWENKYFAGSYFGVEVAAPEGSIYATLSGSGSITATLNAQGELSSNVSGNGAIAAALSAFEVSEQIDDVDKAVRKRRRWISSSPPKLIVEEKKVEVVPLQPKAKKIKIVAIDEKSKQKHNLLEIKQQSISDQEAAIAEQEDFNLRIFLLLAA